MDKRDGPNKVAPFLVYLTKQEAVLLLQAFDNAISHPSEDMYFAYPPESDLVREISNQLESQGVKL